MDDTFKRVIVQAKIVDYIGIHTIQVTLADFQVT